jgi:hypothetical protein
VTGEVVAQFVQFAEQECRGSSRLYEWLAQHVAADPALLSLADGRRAGQRAPNLLFGAVHMLLLKGVDDPLADFYPTVRPGADPDGDPFPLFRAFCRAHTAEIRRLVRTKLGQTNEVGRCTALLPVYGLPELRRGKLTLVEVGASAGLNLRFDRYRYEYDDGQRFGPAGGVVLPCEVHGSFAPPVPKAPPRIEGRIGIDLNPLRASDPEHALWLRALVWPDEVDRMERLEGALAIAARDKADVRRGDALDLLPGLLPTLSADAIPVIVHTFTLFSFTPEQRAGLDAILTGAGRVIWRVAAESLKGDHPELTLTRYAKGYSETRTLSHVDPHGAWIEWLAAP